MWHKSCYNVMRNDFGANAICSKVVARPNVKSALCYNGAFFAIMMAKRILKCHTHYHSQEQKLI